MATGQLSGVIQHLRRAVLLRDEAGMTDGQLLEEYISRRDEAAFVTLVQRHGPMVWGVCRRILGSYHNAEDAFQATFLVLVRRAASIAAPELLANWLYGVAYQTAIKARATVLKRKARERQVTDMPEPAAVEQDVWDDLRPLLDQELSRLPDIYRVVIVLCDLEGHTRKEAARNLGLPEGTVGSRLARARMLLAKRLTDRGVTLSGVVLAAVLAENVALAGVPVSVVACTIKAASHFAAGQTAAGVISPRVAALTEGVLKAMSMSKLKVVVALMLLLGFLATGATGLTFRTTVPHGDQLPAAENKVKSPEKPEKEKEGFTAWGKEVGGLQAGLGYKPGQKRAYHTGETVTLVVRVRNVGKEEIQFQYLRHFFIENPPVVTDDKGQSVPVKDCSPKGIYMPLDVSLAPGREIALYELHLELSNNKGLGVPRDSTLSGTGKFNVQYERVLGNSSLSSVSIRFDPTLSKLATGKLELEVKEAAKGPGKKAKEEQEKFTAWGKEVGGLQAGLGYRPGEKRAYHHGETVRLILRIRNVSKNNVRFDYHTAFLRETAPAVTDAKGNAIPLAWLTIRGGLQGLGQVDLAPGKEIEFYEVKLELKPASEQGNKMLRTLYGTGTFHIQYKQVDETPSGAGVFYLNPLLSKLATGKLELEIKPPRRRADTGEPAVHRFSVVVNTAAPWPRATRCAFLDNDRILVQPGTADGLEVRDAKTGKVLKRVGIDGQLLGDFRLSADRKWVAAVTTPDPTGTLLPPRLEADITVWDTATWKVRGTIDSRGLLALAGDGRTVLVTHNGRVEVWDLVKMAKLKAAPFEFTRIDAAALSPDGSLATVSGLNEIAHWKWREDGDKFDRLKVGRKVDALVFSPSGELVAEGPDSRGTVEIRDAATLKAAHELSDPAQPRVPFTVAGMVFTDAGKSLVLGNGISLIKTIPVPHRIHFWDVKSGRITRKIDLKGGAPYSLDVSPDGMTLAVVTADAGVSLRVFDLRAAEPE